jgi:hypothetical protein
MNKFAAILLVMSSIFLVSAQHEQAGTTDFSLLNISVDARSIGLAGASAAIPNSIYGVFTNPSSIAVDTESINVLLGYISIMDGLWGIPAAASRSFGKFGVISVNMFSANTSVDERDAQNNVTGNVLSYNYINGGVSWGYKILDGLYTGASLKGVYNKIADYNAGALYMDAGIQYRLQSERLIYGFTIHNLGFIAEQYTSESEGKLPYTFEGGISFVPKTFPSLRLAMDVNKKKGDYVNFEPAVEVNIYKKVLVMRLGYAFSQRDASNVADMLQNSNDDDYQKSNLSSLCAGAGLKTDISGKKLVLDFGIKFASMAIVPSISVSGMISL